jgi:hypothetical protein
MEFEIRVMVGDVDELCKVVDALSAVQTATAPVQMDLPLIDKPKPAPKARRTPRATEKAAVAPQAVEPVKVNGEALDDDDDDALRAQVAFEGKRITRTLGIGGMRAAIRKVTGENILQIDDVPVAQLPALLTALQAL